MAFVIFITMVGIVLVFLAVALIQKYVINLGSDSKLTDTTQYEAKTSDELKLIYNMLNQDLIFIHRKQKAIEHILAERDIEETSENES